MVDLAGAWALAQAAGQGQAFGASAAQAISGKTLDELRRIYYTMNPQLQYGSAAADFYGSEAANAQAAKILGTTPQALTPLQNFTQNLGNDVSDKSTLEKELNLLTGYKNYNYSPQELSMMAQSMGVPISEVINAVFKTQAYVPSNVYTPSNITNLTPYNTVNYDLADILTGNNAGTGGWGNNVASSRVVSEGGYDFLVSYDAGGKELSRELLGKTETNQMTDYQKQQVALAQEEYKQNLITSQQQYEVQMLQLQQSGRATEYDYSLALKKYEQSVKEADMTFSLKQRELGLSESQLAADTEYQKAQMELDKQKFAWEQTLSNAQLEQENRAYAANLAANPKSWLEYAAFTGNAPVIQPWMQPLMPEQYKNLSAGTAIPGISSINNPTGMTGISLNPDGTIASITNGSPVSTSFDYSNLPELLNPSRQYQARIGPTAYSQYTGYQQARTGMTPEELEFRLWSQSAPGGSYKGLDYNR